MTTDLTRIIKIMDKDYPLTCEDFFKFLWNYNMENNLHIDLTRDMRLYVGDYASNPRVYFMPLSMAYGIFVEYFLTYNIDLIHKTHWVYSCVGLSAEGIRQSQIDAILFSCNSVEEYKKRTMN